jgi:ubiquinone/menaquinone biosynthesis C-methylase UbiE
MDKDILLEQLAYYKARAGEYDGSLQGFFPFNGPIPGESEATQEWIHIVRSLHALSPAGEVLELACGTGIWTQELLKTSQSITALDGSPEMIEINQAKTCTAAIDYHCVDLFQWEPEKQYDLVFFAFWLSHIPPAHLSNFLGKVARATKPGGRVIVIDEPKSQRNISGPNLEGQYQQRKLKDGRTFRIVKVYYDPWQIELELQKHGFKTDSSMIGTSFFYLCASITT